MKVIILAGGLGTRLRSVVSDVPKPLAPVGDKAFLGWVLKALTAKGISEVILSVGYLAETFEQFILEQKVRLPELKIDLMVEPQQLGTGGALRLCHEHFADDYYLVMNGDSYCDFHIASFVSLLDGNPSAMVVSKVDDIRRYGEVAISNQQTVVEFREKGDVIKSGWINSGIYLIPASVVDETPLDTSFSLEQKIIPELVKKGLGCYKSTSPFIDIGIPQDYRTICENPQTYFN